MKAIVAIILFAIVFNLSNTAETVVDVCSLAPYNDSPIRCTGYMNVFYYDSEKGECVSFVYEGCNTSGNLFYTKALCEARCKSDVCSLPPYSDNPTRCIAYLPAFYYNSAKDECVSFVYGGCNTSGNLFYTKSICETLCKVQ